MRKVYIYLNNGKLVPQFLNTLNRLDGSFELISEHTILNARSILGIYLLDLSAPLLLKVEKDGNENMEMLSPFIIED